MEFQKIVNFLDATSDDNNLPKFVIKIWIKVYDQSQGNYKVNKEIRIKTSMLRLLLLILCYISSMLLIASQKLMV